MTRTRRTMIIGLGGLAGLALVAALALWLVIGTEAGTRLVAERATSWLPAGIEVGQIEGRLGDRLVIHDVAVATDTLQLALERIELAWRPWRLAARELRLAELAVTGVGITLRTLPEAPAPGVAPEPFALPERLVLPVAVALERVAVRRITLFTDLAAEPLVIDAIDLAANFADSRLRVAALGVRSALLDADAALELTASQDYPLSGRLDWTLRHPDYPAASGTTVLTGSLAELGVEQRVASPYNTRVTATLTELLEPAEPLRVEARAEIVALDTAALVAELPPMTVSAALRAAGPVGALVVDGEVAVTQPAHDGRVAAAGTVRLGGDALEAQLELDWERLPWPLLGEPQLRSPRGELRLAGRLDEYRFASSAELEVPGQPVVSLALTGTGNLERLAAELDARTAIGRVTGDANLAWSPALEARVELAGEGFDPALLSADWPGEIGFTLSAEGRAGDDGVSARIERLEARGVVRDQPLDVTARGAYRQLGDDARSGFVADIAELSASLGGVRLDVAGRVEETAELTWRIEGEDLSVLLDSSRGSLTGSGTVSGPALRPRITAQVEAASLAFADYTLAELALDASVDLAGTTPSTLQLAARGGNLDGTELEQLLLDASGTPDAHELGVDLRSSAGDLTATIAGRLVEETDREPLWQFRVTSARIAHSDLAPWQLDAQAEGHASASVGWIERHCWSSAAARLCLDGARDTAGIAAAFELSALPFEYFAPLLPDGQRISGGLDATGHWRLRADGALTGEAEIATTAGEIALSADPIVAADAELTRLRFAPSHARVTLEPLEAIAALELAIEHGHVRLDARLTASEGTTDPVPLGARALAGTLAIEVPDLAFVGDFVEELSEIGGAITGHLDLGGTLAAPVLGGEIALRDGRAVVPLAGITVAGLTATVAGQRDGVELTASAASGGGTITVSGEVGLLGEAPTATLRVQGESFQLTNTRDARIFVSPDLRVTAGAERIEVTGDVRVPRAEITPATQSASAVTVSADEVLLTGEEQDEAPATGRALDARIRLVLGDAVSFDGFGLTGRLRGDVLAVQAPGLPTTGSGEINILGGEYRAYGQGLVIETGNIYFAGGPITEPALDIRAVRRPRAGILVGAHVVGTLETPSFTLFSEPPMTELEQLSYLVLGRSLQESPTGETSALSQAALAMGLRGGDFLARNIGERIGVDQLAIETGTGEAGAASSPSQAALVVGKYLSPQLYVSYGIGLFDPINVLRIQYTISDRWRVVTQSSSEATGADIVYAIERGR